MVFVERSGKRERPLADMPVRIVDAHGKVIYEGRSNGPSFLARLPKGRYTVSTQWDAWCPSRPVDIGEAQPRRIVFAWSEPQVASRPC
ncbi:MAG: hypothetical protein ACXWG9_17960 [Usitatibacter sp.]